MNIRKAQLKDLPGIMAIYDYAKVQMAAQGNPTQWGDEYPSKKILSEDIAGGNCYVIDKEGKPAAVFVFIVGKEPTYSTIDGKWLNDELYGTLHRIASNGKIKGVFNTCIEFCASIMPNIRIDTHKDNKVMLSLLSRCGFTRCGIIIVGDGTPRLAFQKNYSP